MRARLVALLPALLAATLLADPAGAQTQAAQTEEPVVNVYSARQRYPMEERLFEGFERATGIRVNLSYIEQGLAERVAQEGANSPVDVIVTADIGNLTAAIGQGIVRPIPADAALDAAVPETLRDPEHRWLTLATRARLIYQTVDTTRLGANAAPTYERLACPTLRGRVCSRSFAHPYSVALTASVLAASEAAGGDAEARTRLWLEGVRRNLARKPEGNDTKQIEDIAAGACDLAIANSYYYARLAADPAKASVTQAVTHTFPNQGDRGTHVNISGAAIARHAPHPQNALELLRYMVSPEAQAIYAGQNFEFPVRSDVDRAPTVAAFGAFRTDATPIAAIGERRPRASALIEAVNVDAGPTADPAEAVRDVTDAQLTEAFCATP